MYNLEHPKGVGGLTSNFLRGGGMDVFWNDRQSYKVAFYKCVQYVDQQYKTFMSKLTHKVALCPNAPYLFYSV